MTIHLTLTTPIIPGPMYIIPGPMYIIPGPMCITHLSLIICDDTVMCPHWTPEPMPQPLDATIIAVYIHIACLLPSPKTRPKVAYA